MNYADALNMLKSRLHVWLMIVTMVYCCVARLMSFTLDSAEVACVEFFLTQINSTTIQ